jgi:plasmid stability protein
MELVRQTATDWLRPYEQYRAPVRWVVGGAAVAVAATLVYAHQRAAAEQRAEVPRRIRRLQGAERVYYEPARVIPGGAKVAIAAVLRFSRPVSSDLLQSAVADALRDVQHLHALLRVHVVDGSLLLGRKGSGTPLPTLRLSVVEASSVEEANHCEQATLLESARAHMEAAINVGFLPCSCGFPECPAMLEAALHVPRAVQSCSVTSPTGLAAEAASGEGPSAVGVTSVALELVLHHMICDGISAAALVGSIARQLECRLFHEPALGACTTEPCSEPAAGTAAVEGLPLSAIECVRARYPSPLRRAWMTLAGLAQELLFPARFAPLPLVGAQTDGRMAGPLRTRLLLRCLPPDVTAALAARARGHGASVNAALSAALAAACAAMRPAVAAGSSTDSANASPAAGASSSSPDTMAVLIRTAASTRPMLCVPPVVPASQAGNAPLGYFASSVTGLLEPAVRRDLVPRALTPASATANAAAAAATCADSGDGAVIPQQGPRSGVAMPAAAAAAEALWRLAAAAAVRQRAELGSTCVFRLALLKESFAEVMVKQLTSALRDDPAKPPGTLMTSNIGDVARLGLVDAGDEASSGSRFCAAMRSPEKHSSTGAGAVSQRRNVTVSRLVFCSSTNAWRAAEVTAASVNGELGLIFALPQPASMSEAGQAAASAQAAGLADDTVACLQAMAASAPAATASASRP